MSTHIPFQRILTMMTKYLCALSAIVIMGADCQLRAQDANKTVEQKLLPTADGWQIAVEYYKITGNPQTPVVMILHGENSNALAWKKDFAEPLHQLGYAVALIDLRKHGNSKTMINGATSDTADLRPTDYEAMIIYDIETVKEFLISEHQQRNLNIRKLGLLSSDMSVPLALGFAELDWNKPPYDDAPVPAMRTPRGQDVHAIAMISPTLVLPRVNSTVAARNLSAPVRQIQFFIAMGKDDANDKGQTKRLEKLLMTHPSNTERITFKQYASNLNGVMLANRTPTLKQDLMAFFDKNLMKYDVEWIDRRSRLLR